MSVGGKESHIEVIFFADRVFTIMTRVKFPIVLRFASFVFCCFFLAFSELLSCMYVCVHLCAGVFMCGCMYVRHVWSLHY